MPAILPSYPMILLGCGILFGALDILVFYRLLRVTHGLRRALAGLVLFSTTYWTVVYSLSFVGWLPDGTELLSLLLRPVVVGLLGSLAAYGILDRRR